MYRATPFAEASARGSSPSLLLARPGYICDSHFSQTKQGHYEERSARTYSGRRGGSPKAVTSSPWRSASALRRPCSAMTSRETPSSASIKDGRTSKPLPSGGGGRDIAAHQIANSTGSAGRGPAVSSAAASRHGVSAAVYASKVAARSAALSTQAAASTSVSYTHLTLPTKRIV